MKISLIYFSDSGNTEKTAGYIKTGMEKVEGVEVKLFGIDNVDEEFVTRSDAVLFGAPTYYATAAWQLFRFLHETHIPLAGKLGGAFSTSGYFQGGSEFVLTELNTYMLTKGMLVYSAGVSMGEPMSHLGVHALGGRVEEEAETLTVYGERMAKKAAEIFG